MSELQRIRTGSPDSTDFEEHRPASGATPTSSMVINGNGTVDWRQRKAGRVSKMERSNLQLALNNEIRERELAQQRARELEVQLEEATKYFPHFFLDPLFLKKL